MVRVAGRAVHSGLTCSVTLHRVAGPTRFRRGYVEVPADLAHVIGAERATSLGADGAKVHMVEHLLAALRVAGFFAGVLVEASADELPILDGSAAPWAAAVAELGEPPPAPAPLVMTAPVSVSVGGARGRVMPGRESLAYEIEFAHPAIGVQTWAGGPGAYGELLEARTFGFLSDREALLARGLALGADEEHVIVFAMDGPSRPLRHAQEPVRHKALDALGDLALLGRPLEGAVSIHRGSHALHHELARAALRHVGAE